MGKGETVTSELDEQEILFNRTGVMTHPEQSGELIQGAQETTPSSEGDAAELGSARAEYLNEGLPIGSYPTAELNIEQAEEPEVARNEGPTSILLDKLGERLAFERQGTRLYQVFLQKLQALTRSVSGGPSVDELRHICDEELEHFRLLQKAIVALGGDATVQTPSADVAGVLSNGALQVVSDPRTTVPQTLQAALTAELADNDGWQMLRELAGELGHTDLEEQCTKALEEEEEHLANVRAWLSGLTLNEALGNELASAKEEQVKNGRSGRAKKKRSSTSKKRRKK